MLGALTDRYLRNLEICDVRDDLDKFMNQTSHDTFFLPEALHPYFPSIVENVTVSHGRKAVLKCEVDNLRNYKVSSVNCCIGIQLFSK